MPIRPVGLELAAVSLRDGFFTSSYVYDFRNLSALAASLPGSAHR